MCGITGLVHFAEPQRQVSREVLIGMTNSLAHRGPDSGGYWLQSNVGLGHRRLAVLDPTPAGHQPMLDQSGDLAVTFNGEIYNFRELRRDLESRGYQFRTHTDTEVLLNGFHAWGAGVLQRLSGIFAFAVWSRRSQSLFLGRDPLGVKPLFYAFQGGTLRFGSELKAILSDPNFERDVDPEGVDAFLTFGYSPAPLTGVRAIEQLPPGHYAVVSAAGLELRRYWQVHYAPRERPFEQAVSEFSELLSDVTRDQMVSDVPLGTFLSGGLDSIAIGRAMRRQTTAPIRAITMGFRDRGFDESARATAAARALDLEHSVHWVNVEAASLLSKVSLHLEDPIADASALPVYLLCQAAKAEITVAMSGDGADETLAGYDTYLATHLARAYRLLPGWSRARLPALARRIPVSDKKYGLHQFATRFVSGAEEGPGRDHAAWRRMLDPTLKRTLYAADYRSSVEHYDALARYAALTRQGPDSDLLTGLLRADTEFFLPNDMLVKVDRMSMAHGLEVRVPFLDVRMVEFAAGLPSRFKLRRYLRRKHVLRESLRGAIPDDVLNAPKSGFNTPIEVWMRGPLRELLLDTCRSSRHELGRFVQLGEVEQLARAHADRRADHAHLLFTLLMFGLWLRNLKESWRLIPALPLIPTQSRDASAFSATTTSD